LCSHYYIVKYRRINSTENALVQEIRVIDSHTGGEPTRVVIHGGPDLGNGDLAQRLASFRSEHDRFRSAVVNEPRGSDVVVGAMLVEPRDPSCVAGVLFFNNTGYLGMCGHGSIGLMTTLAHLGRIRAGEHRIETPVGIITAILHGDGSVSIDNVPSYRLAKDVTVQVSDDEQVTGDVAWGGNWFFLVERHGRQISLANARSLTDFTTRVRAAVNAAGYSQVDHVELFAPTSQSGANSCNFVLCPGGEYDRSPCGTGTSAKLACLAADGKLREGDTWVQASIIGSTFEASYRWIDRASGHIAPRIKGIAHLTADATLLLDPDDGLRWGIRR
jgi:4-hydroxyproline epimerase